uniref:Putative tick transposon n=1 Tax=Rhipicephalus microplus TaxID=6941 RepID=A0A6M2CJD0_RHIMP
METGRGKKISVIPYMHNISHRLRKIGQQCGVRVVFSAPHKLSYLSRVTCPVKKRKRQCTTKHRKKFLDCSHNVIYRIPLSCGCCYIGQTGRCLNDRLREHKNNVRNAKEGFLAIHCSSCGCTPLFEETTIIGRHQDMRTREIIEAAHIAKEGSLCISMASIGLSAKELSFLEERV